MKFSNTGKTITIRMPNGLIGNRYKVTLTHNNVVLVEPSERTGYVVQKSNCITVYSKHYPDWPHHGAITVEHEQTAFQGFRFVIPDGPLPPPRIFAHRKKHTPAPIVYEPVEITTPPPLEPREAVLLSINNRTYEFHVPAHELLDTVLNWGTKGYGKVS